jgi:hypothetical protein
MSDEKKEIKKRKAKQSAAITADHIVVTPVKIGEGEKQTKKALGWRLFPEPYGNIFLLAQKQSGKTTVIYNIMKHCCNEYTKRVYIFASTVHVDPIYKEMITMIEDMGVEVEQHTHFIENGHNVLKGIIREFQEEAEKGEPAEIYGMVGGDRGSAICRFDEDPKKQKRESKEIVPEYFFIFDDLGQH